MSGHGGGMRWRRYGGTTRERAPTATGTRACDLAVGGVGRGRGRRRSSRPSHPPLSGTDDGGEEKEGVRSSPNIRRTNDDDAGGVQLKHKVVWSGLDLTRRACCVDAFSPHLRSAQRRRRGQLTEV